MQKSFRKVSWTAWFLSSLSSSWTGVYKCSTGLNSFTLALVRLFHSSTHCMSVIHSTLNIPSTLKKDHKHNPRLIVSMFTYQPHTNFCFKTDRCLMRRPLTSPKEWETLHTCLSFSFPLIYGLSGTICTDIFYPCAERQRSDVPRSEETIPPSDAQTEREGKQTAGAVQRGTPTRDLVNQRRRYRVRGKNQTYSSNKNNLFISVTSKYVSMIHQIGSHTCPSRVTTV